MLTTVLMLLWPLDQIIQPFTREETDNTDDTDDSDDTGDTDDTADTDDTDDRDNTDVTKYIEIFGGDHC